MGPVAPKGPDVPRRNFASDLLFYYVLVTDAILTARRTRRSYEGIGTQQVFKFDRGSWFFCLLCLRGDDHGHGQGTGRCAISSCVRRGSECQDSSNGDGAVG